MSPRPVLHFDVSKCRGMRTTRCFSSPAGEMTTKTFCLHMYACMDMWIWNPQWASMARLVRICLPNSQCLSTKLCLLMMLCSATPCSRVAVIFFGSHATWELRGAYHLFQPVLHHASSVRRACLRRWLHSVPSFTSKAFSCAITSVLKDASWVRRNEENAVMRLLSIWSAMWTARWDASDMSTRRI